MFAQPCTVPFVDNKLYQLLVGMSKEADTMLKHSSTTANRQAERERSIIANLYRYSDLSVEAIAQQVDMDANEVQKIVDNLVKNDALEVVIEQSTTRVEKIMMPIVITLDCSKTVREAAALMAEKEIGSVIVTKGGRPFGIVTHSDIARWAGLRQQLLNVELEGLASRPLITVGRGASVEDAAKAMIENQIHKLLIIDDQGKLLGIVTITDLAVFLSPSRRPGMALSVLQALSRGKIQQ
jgi:CBS domain-containing protein/predicted HTH domain antitoxin